MSSTSYLLSLSGYFRLDIDLIFEINEKTQRREFGNLIEIQDNYPKYVVTMDKFSSGSYKGIEHVHIIDFLMKDL